MTIGIDGHIGLKQETTYGTQVTPDVFGEIKGEDFNFDNNLETPIYIGNTNTLKRAIMGNLITAGTVTLDLMPLGLMPWLLKGLFGSVSSSLVAAGVYDHTYGISNSLPSFTIQTDRNYGCFNWLGSEVVSMDIGITRDSVLLESSIAFTSQRPLTVAVETPTYPDCDPWTAFEVAVTLNGVEDLNFRNINLTFARDTEPNFTLNQQRYPSGSTAKMFTAGLSFEIEPGDTDQWERALGAVDATSPQKTQTPQTLSVSIVSTNAITGAYYYTLTLDFYELYISTANAPNSAPNDRILQTIEMIPIHNTVAGKMINCVLRNSDTSYPDPS